MLVKLTCVAIVIAFACFQMTSGASLNTKTTNKVAEKTETLKKEVTTDTKNRNKRALYYQNDLVSNQERQMRKLFPFGTVYPFYDYLYGGLPLYDNLLYDYGYLDPLYPLYPLYGAAAVASPVVPPVGPVGPVAPGPVPIDYNYDYPITVQPLSATRHTGGRDHAKPLSATRPLSHGAPNGFNPMQQFGPPPPSAFHHAHGFNQPRFHNNGQFDAIKAATAKHNTI